MGLADSPEDVANEVKKVTRRVGWRYFKMLDEEDYLYTSQFAQCLMTHLGYHAKDLEEHEMVTQWNCDVGHVRAAYQTARSGVTQAIKKAWLGTSMCALKIMGTTNITNDIFIIIRAIQSKYIATFGRNDARENKY
jgi:hypothetical protein